MKTLMKMEDYVFSQIESPTDIDRLIVEDFEYFKGLGIIDYKRTFKAWLRKFPRPVFLIVTRQNRIISWVHIDEWRQGVAKDGNSINILRAIETLPAYRNKKIGYRLVFLGLQLTVGYMMTKPISSDSKRFFKEIGFMEEAEIKNCPVDLRRHPGYLIMPLYRKGEFIIDFTKKFLTPDHDLKSKINRTNNLKKEQMNQKKVLGQDDGKQR